MKSNSIALAMMVKTVGLSPVKTRLAAKIGTNSAVQFYQRSVQVLSNTLKDLSTEFDVQPYYAFAELSGAEHWNLFPNCYQGEGGLGQRLNSVYSSLLNKHKAVVIIGSDLPQLSKKILTECFESLLQNPEGFCVGPTEDGGFYLMGGSTPIPERVWLETPYSVPQTKDHLCSLLSKQGRIIHLTNQFDIDEEDDLIKFRENLKNFTIRCPALTLFDDFIWPERKQNAPQKHLT
jgi:uncharacterized protein